MAIGSAALEEAVFCYFPRERSAWLENNNRAHKVLCARCSILWINFHRLQTQKFIHNWHENKIPKIGRVGKRQRPLGEERVFGLYGFYESWRGGSSQVPDGAPESRRGISGYQKAPPGNFA